MSVKVMLELKPNQIEEILERLSIQEKLRIIRKLENQTWAKRLDGVVTRIRKRLRQNPISDTEITQICEEARQKIYNGRNKSCN